MVTSMAAKSAVATTASVPPKPAARGRTQPRLIADQFASRKRAPRGGAPSRTRAEPTQTMADAAQNGRTCSVASARAVSPRSRQSATSPRY
jgi:hypothetical protein